LRGARFEPIITTHEGGVVLMVWILVLGLVVFFAVHSVRIFADPWRASQVAANERRWKGLYSLASLVGFALIVWGWIAYRPEAPQVYIPPGWGRWVAIVLVWAAFVLLAAAYAPPGYIKSTAKHPFLTGVILWGIAHLLANGDLAGVLLFGAFLLYALLDRIAVIPRGSVVYAIFGYWLHPLLFGVGPFI
jgi:uncharacterized membrane protein